MAVNLECKKDQAYVVFNKIFLPYKSLYKTPVTVKNIDHEIAKQQFIPDMFVFKLSDDSTRIGNNDCLKTTQTDTELLIRPQDR